MYTLSVKLVNVPIPRDQFWSVFFTIFPNVFHHHGNLSPTATPGDNVSNFHVCGHKTHSKHGWSWAWRIDAIAEATMAAPPPSLSALTWETKRNRSEIDFLFSYIGPAQYTSMGSGFETMGRGIRVSLFPNFHVFCLVQCIGDRGHYCYAVRFCFPLSFPNNV